MNKLRRILQIVLCVLVVHIFPDSNALADQDLLQIRQLNKKVVTLYRSQQYEDAVPYATKALKLIDWIGKPHPAVLVQTLNNLAELKRHMGDLVTAEALLLRSLRVSVRYLGKTHSSVPIICNNLALVYENFGKFPEAEALYQRSLGIRKKRLGVNHPKVVTLAHKLAALSKKRARQNM
jgi:tetratricopeptide (TPR) repeat protein